MPDSIIDETWKLCFDGFYAVSNMGRIRRAQHGHIYNEAF